MSSSEEEILKPCLPVEDIEMEENDENPYASTSGGYLKFVQEERKKCPKIVVAKRRKENNAKQTVFYTSSEDDGLMPAPDGLGSPVEWQDYVLKHFDIIREHLLKRRQQRKPSKSANLSEKDCCQFCLGTDSPEEENPTAAKQPTFNLLLTLNAAKINYFLEIFANWLDDYELTSLKSKWLYAILVGIETPLVPHVCHDLRRIARGCARHRSTCTIDSEFLAQYNLFITLVTRYFGQSDLVG